VTYGSTSEGVSHNREIEGDGDAAMVLHYQVAGSNRDISPGNQVDGSLWVATPRIELTINELLPNPDGTDTGQEFIELVNTGSTTFNLDGWTVSDAVTVRHTFGSWNLQPGEVVVLYDSGDHTGPSDMLSSTGSLSLNNTGDTISVRDASGALVDAVNYQNSRSGVSLNRAEDANTDAELVDHTDVSGGSSSPGRTVNGGFF
jgi:hypothetical protein